MSVRQRLAAAAVAVAGAATFAGVTAAPAQAAEPVCTGYSVISGAYVPTYAGSKSCYLNLGKTGSGVSALQRALRYCYNKSIAIDGSFGYGTRDALIAVQRANGWIADGGYGPQTRTYISYAGYDRASGGWTCFGRR